MGELEEALKGQIITFILRNYVSQELGKPILATKDPSILLQTKDVVTTLNNIKNNQSAFQNLGSIRVKFRYLHTDINVEFRYLHTDSFLTYQIKTLEELITLANQKTEEEKKPEKEELLSLGKFKIMFNTLMRNFPNSNITNQKKEVFDNFFHFFQANQDDFPDRKDLIRAWINSYKEVNNENPFKILNKQRRNLDFISSLPFFGEKIAKLFTPTLTDSTKLFLKFAGAVNLEELNKPEVIKKTE